MPSQHQVKLIVTIDKEILSAPDCSMLPIKQGDSVVFSSPHGDFAIQFADPHVFSSGLVTTQEPAVQVVGVGRFTGACSITLPSGEKVASAAGKSYGLDGVSEGGSGTQQPTQTPTV